MAASASADRRGWDDDSLFETFMYVLLLKGRKEGRKEGRRGAEGRRAR
jgi:hypothetical protein